MFEHAKWIGWQPPGADGPAEFGEGAPLLRGRFVLDKQPVRGSLAVCGLGLGEYYINGQSATTDVLTTPYSQYDKTVYYSVYDVSALLRRGENVFAAMLGNGMYNDIAATWDFEKAPWRHHPKLLMQLDITFSDGTCRTVVSDTSFVWADGPITFNHARCGEHFDARLEPNGWTTLPFDDSGWQHVAVCRAPGGLLQEANMPPIRVTQTLPAKKIGDSLYDLGQNISGWVQITTRGPAGQEIILTYAERLGADGSIDADNINRFNHTAPHQDRYILRGGKTERWHPRFAYHGFRYVEVTGAPAKFSLEGMVVHTDLPIIGEFSCGCDMLNRIHSATRWSTLCNFHGIPTDCPHREQNGWTGDACLSAEQSLMNYDMNASYQKWLADIRDAQRPSGQIPGIVPTGGWGYDWGSGPAWDAALILIPHYVYQYTGDMTAIWQCWQSMQRYMDFIASMAEDDIVCFGLGDWCAPKETDVCDTAVTDTAYYYVFAKTMAACAALLGEDAAPYASLAEQIRSKFRARFLRDGVIDNGGQTATACGIYQGLYDPDECPAAAKRLAELVRDNGYHIDCGILGAKYIFSALAEYGYDDVLYRMVTNPTYPSYAHWINSGMTTLCEDWGMENSLLHHMYSEVELWFYRYLAGIRPAKPGFSEVIIQPHFLPDVGWVKARHRDIVVKWDADKLTIQTPVPAVLRMDGREEDLAPGSYIFPR